MDREISKIKVVSLSQTNQLHPAAGSPSDVAVSVAATAAVPVLLTPEAAVAADGAPSVVLGATWRRFNGSDREVL
jgi:hypothetical protein